MVFSSIIRVVPKTFFLLATMVVNFGKHQSNFPIWEIVCSFNFLANALQCYMKTFSAWFFVFTILPVLTNHAEQFISHGIACIYFSGYLPLSFLIRNDFDILAKSREGGNLKSSIVCYYLASIISFPVDN